MNPEFCRPHQHHPFALGDFVNLISRCSLRPRRPVHDYAVSHLTRDSCGALPQKPVFRFFAPPPTHTPARTHRRRSNQSSANSAALTRCFMYLSPTPPPVFSSRPLLVLYPLRPPALPLVEFLSFIPIFVRCSPPRYQPTHFHLALSLLSRLVSIKKGNPRKFIFT